VLTNAHVVDRCSSIDVKADNGDVVSGRVLAKGTTNDLVLLRTPLKSSKVAGIRLGIRLGEGGGIRIPADHASVQFRQLHPWKCHGPVRTQGRQPIPSDIGSGAARKLGRSAL
jgi:hypothetical protein